MWYRTSRTYEISLHLILLIMISISLLANDKPTAFDPNNVMLVVGKSEEMKKTMN